MMIRKGLLQVSGGPYGQVGNVYAMQHDAGWLLIDSGNPDAFDTIVRNLRYWGVSPEQISHVLLTHAHFDHAGTAVRFQQLGAQVLVGQADSTALRQGGPGADSPFTDHAFPACEPDIRIASDCEFCIGGLQVHALVLPGHSAGSVVYQIDRDGECLLFSGDMFVCDGDHGDRAEPWWRGDMGYSAAALGESFARLWNMHLQPDVIAGGHGVPRIGADAGEMIAAAYRKFLEEYR